LGDEEFSRVGRILGCGQLLPHPLGYMSVQTTDPRCFVAKSSFGQDLWDAIFSYAGFKAVTKAMRR
jgi:hypothetical protein